MTDHPHRRFNPLRQEWVLVSPRRNERPWLGQIDPPSHRTTVAHDPECYLCPGNTRAGGARNPDYTSTFVFDNDFPALRSDGPASQASATAEPFFATSSERGICRVLCYAPRHDVTLSQMSRESIRRVVDTWVEECRTVAGQSWVRYALVFENRGEMMGASNPHPHGQLWATESVPSELMRERQGMLAYGAAHGGSCLLCDYLTSEAARRERLVCENDAFVAVVPFWAVWPFETLLVSRRHAGALADLDSRERDALADILKRLTVQYDALFETPFPYSMGFHQAPLAPELGEGWHLHAHFYPPLLRSASIRKFMVGFELLGEAQRDLTPEQAAARLREVSR